MERRLLPPGQGSVISWSHRRHFPEHNEIETRYILEVFPVSGEQAIAVLNRLAANPDILDTEFRGAASFLEMRSSFVHGSTIRINPDAGIDYHSHGLCDSSETVLVTRLSSSQSSAASSGSVRYKSPMASIAVR